MWSRTYKIDPAFMNSMERLILSCFLEASQDKNLFPVGKYKFVKRQGSPLKAVLKSHHIKVTHIKLMQPLLWYKTDSLWGYRYELLGEPFGHGATADILASEGTLCLDEDKLVYFKPKQHAIKRKRNIGEDLVASYKIASRALHLHFKFPTIAGAHNYTVMQRFSGQELFEYVDDERTEEDKFFPLNLRIDLSIRAIRTLQEQVFDINMTHRDIKLENVIANILKLNTISDFNIIDYDAAALIDEVGRAVISNCFCFTPDYASPEILKRKPHDQRTDDYSLGVMLALIWRVDVEDLKAFYAGKMTVSEVFKDMPLRGESFQLMIEVIIGLTAFNVDARMSSDKALRLIETLKLKENEDLSDDDREILIQANSVALDLRDKLRELSRNDKMNAASKDFPLIQQLFLSAMREIPQNQIAFREFIRALDIRCLAKCSSTDGLMKKLNKLMQSRDKCQVRLLKHKERMRHLSFLNESYVHVFQISLDKKIKKYENYHLTLDNVSLVNKKIRKLTKSVKAFNHKLKIDRQLLQAKVTQEAQAVSKHGFFAKSAKFLQSSASSIAVNLTNSSLHEDLVYEVFKM